MTINRQLAVSADANGVNDLHWISIALMEDLSQILLVDKEGRQSRDALIKIFDWIAKVRNSRIERVNLRHVDSNEKAIICCWKCNQNLRVPVGRRIEITCPKCGISKIVEL